MTGEDGAARRAEAHRRRYETFQAGARAAHSRPPPTALGAAAIPPAAVLEHERVPTGWYATLVLARGERLRIVNDTGRSSVALLAWRREDACERINCADTMKVRWSAALGRGGIILSDMGRVMLSVVEDTSGAHDLLVGGSTPDTVFAAAGAAARNTRDNFVTAAAKIGLGVRDIPACITFFAPLTVDAAGHFAWRAGVKRPGDFVDLRAEMNLVVAASNCAHPLDPGGPAAPGPVTLIRHRGPPAAADDPCRTGSPEAERAFAFTERLP